MSVLFLFFSAALLLFFFLLFRCCLFFYYFYFCSGGDDIWVAEVAADFYCFCTGFNIAATTCCHLSRNHRCALFLLLLLFVTFQRTLLLFLLSLSGTLNI